MADRADAREALKALGTRLLSAREARGLKQEFVAEKVGVKQASVSRIEAGKALPGEELLVALADLYELPIEDLRFEIAPAMLDRIPEPYRPFVRLARDAKSAGDGRDARFPVYGLASCGALVESVRDDRLPTGELRLSDAWPNAATSVKSRQSFIVIAEGDSMLPTIRPGDELLVDPRARVRDGDIALVQYRGETHVKRWRVVAGVILLTPDNADRKSFPEKRITKSAFEHGTAWRIIRARTVSDRSL